MEFMNRSGQPRPQTNTAASSAGASKPLSSAGAGNSAGSSSGSLPAFDQHRNKWFRWGFLVLLFSATALFIAMLVFIVFGVPNSRESKYVTNDQFQAVFVNVNGTNGGQVYFGHIKSLTPQFIELTNVFYIQNQASTEQNSQANGSYNLVKLGCELHGPEDKMLINRSEVFFWENLKASSQVAQKAAEFYKQNPTGQKCSSTTNSTQQSTNASGTGAPTAPGTGAATPAPSTTTAPTTTTTPPAATTRKP